MLSISKSGDSATYARVLCGGGGDIPAVAGVEYVSGIDVTAEVDGIFEAALFITFEGSGNGTSVGYLPLIGRTRLELPPTVAGVGTTDISFSLRYRRITTGGLLAGDEIWADGFLLAKGTDPSFIPSLRIVGGLDMRAKVAAVDWTPASTQYLLSRRDDTLAFGKETFFRLNADGSVSTGFTITGIAAYDIVASNPLGLVDGSVHELRTVVDVDNGAGNYETSFYVDGVLDKTTPGAGGQVLALYPQESALTIGRYKSNATGGEFAGDIYWAELRDGIDGPVTARFDAVDVP